jgi:myo-inositol catabolism protein IolC
MLNKIQTIRILKQQCIDCGKAASNQEKWTQNRYRCIECLIFYKNTEANQVRVEQLRALKSL